MMYISIYKYFDGSNIVSSGRSFVPCLPYHLQGLMYFSYQFIYIYIIFILNIKYIYIYTIHIYNVYKYYIIILYIIYTLEVQDETKWAGF